MFLKNRKIAMLTVSAFRSMLNNLLIWALEESSVLRLKLNLSSRQHEINCFIRLVWSLNRESKLSSLKIAMLIPTLRAF